MTEPSDEELLRFVAEFCGWRRGEPLSLDPDEKKFGKRWIAPNGGDYPENSIPDYTHDLNAWHKDVWPVIWLIGGDLPRLWGHRLAFDMQGGGPVYYGPTSPVVLNATAHDRCLALYHALNGQLPVAPNTKDE